jgi:hypothetical protein
MEHASQWFVTQAISSIRHGIGSKVAFEVARHVKRWAAPRRSAVESSLQGFAVTVHSAPCLAIEDSVGCGAQVLAGQAWITAEGSPLDTIAEAGTTVSLEPGVRFNVSAFRDVATVLITVPRDLQDVGFSLHKRDGMDVLSVTSGSKRQSEPVADGPAVIAAFARRCLAATS